MGLYSPLHREGAAVNICKTCKFWVHTSHGPSDYCDKIDVESPSTQDAYLSSQAFAAMHTTANFGCALLGKHEARIKNPCKDGQ